MATAGPRTPPQTPQHPKFKISPRRPLTTPGSPSSPISTHPTETISPSKPPPQTAPVDTVHVEELTEGDAGYITDIDVVHPAEFEDVDTGSEDEKTKAKSAISSAEESEEGEGSDTGISRHFSRLGYDEEDKEEAQFRKTRRRRHWHKRTESRVFKRTHSQSVKSETEETDVDPDSMANYDNEVCARRLRRRVRGPVVTDVFLEKSAESVREGEGSASRVGRPDASVERRDRRLTPDGSESSEPDDGKPVNDNDAIDLG